MEPRAFGWEQIADCGAMRVVGLRLEAGQRVPEHRTAIPVVLIVTEGRIAYSEAGVGGSVGVGEMLLVDPGERHVYRAEEPSAAYLVFAGVPGARFRPWTLRSRSSDARARPPAPGYGPA
ncbi:MAG: cupin domain-containing protein [Candidatus Dormibacterales bacterium]